MRWCASTIVRAGSLSLLSAYMNPSGPQFRLGKPRRRSKRLKLSVEVQVYGEDVFRESFREFTHMLAVNAYGGLLALAARVQKGQKILVMNRKTREEQECRVVCVGPAQEGKWTVGIEFARPAANFWQICFPPLTPRQPLNART